MREDGQGSVEEVIFLRIDIIRMNIVSIDRIRSFRIQLVISFLFEILIVIE